MTEMKNTYTISDRNPEGKRSLTKHRCRLMDNIIMNLK
jgi:hypothetical protein